MEKTSQAMFGMLLFAALAVTGFGQRIEFDITPRVLNIGEPTTATFTVKGLDHPDPPTLPEVKNLQVRYRGARQNSAITFNNGKMQSEKSVTYTYSLLPMKAGTYDIGPFTYESGTVKADLPRIRLQVVGDQQVNQAEGATSSLADRVLAVMTTTRTNIYFQEVCEIDFTLYFRDLNIGGELSVLNLPDTGLNMLDIKERGSGREERDGQVFEARRFRIRFRAITEGTFVLAPTIRTQMLIRRRDTRRNLFFDDPFFDRVFQNAERHPIEVIPDPLTIQVLGLPEADRPADFSGAVGQFTFDVKASPTRLQAGDPITLTSTIQGQGNLDTVTAPQLALDEDQFRVYESKMSKREMNPLQTAGRKIFEQVVIPRSEDVTELPAMTFSYFDPVQTRYMTHRRGPFPLEITQPEQLPSPVVISVPLPDITTAPVRREVQALNIDIAYLKPAPDQWLDLGRVPWFRRPLCLSGLALPWLVVGMVFITRRRRDLLQRDVARARRQRAPRSARAGLKAAAAAESSGHRDAFFEAIWRAISEYFGNRLNLSPGDVTAPDVLQRLSEAGVDEETVQGLSEICHTCDRARFGGAPDDEQASYRSIRMRLAGLLKTCEKVKL